jgi:hypothetical protein
LKQEAFETKDALWEDVKARAAANPAAVIAIGAGLAWRLLQWPPIATTLIGLGLYSLWNTEPKQPGDGTPDYLKQSRQALKEQTREALSAASRIAGQAQEAAAAIWDDAREKVRKWNEEVGSRLGETASGSDQLDKPFWKTSVPNSMICESSGGCRGQDRRQVSRRGHPQQSVARRRRPRDSGGSRHFLSEKDFWDGGRLVQRGTEIADNGVP